MKLSLNVGIVKNYKRSKVIQDFIFDDHIKTLTENCDYWLQERLIDSPLTHNLVTDAWFGHSRHNNKLYLSNKLVPKGLVNTLVPAIGNYDQSFIDNWYSKPKDIFLDLMEDVASFCDKTIKEANIKIDQIEGILK